MLWMQVMQETSTLDLRWSIYFREITCRSNLDLRPCGITLLFGDPFSCACASFHQWLLVISELGVTPMSGTVVTKHLGFLNHRKMLPSIFVRMIYSHRDCCVENHFFRKESDSTFATTALALVPWALWLWMATSRDFPSLLPGVVQCLLQNTAIHAMVPRLIRHLFQTIFECQVLTFTVLSPF